MTTPSGRSTEHLFTCRSAFSLLLDAPLLGFWGGRSLLSLCTSHAERWAITTANRSILEPTIKYWIKFPGKSIKSSIEDSHLHETQAGMVGLDFGKFRKHYPCNGVTVHAVGLTSQPFSALLLSLSSWGDKDSEALLRVSSFYLRSVRILLPSSHGEALTRQVSQKQLMISYCSCRGSTVYIIHRCVKACTSSKLEVHTAHNQISKIDCSCINHRFGRIQMRWLWPANNV